MQVAASEMPYFSERKRVEKDGPIRKRRRMEGERPKICASNGGKIDDDFHRRQIVTKDCVDITKKSIIPLFLDVDVPCTSSTPVLEFCAYWPWCIAVQSMYNPTTHTRKITMHCLRIVLLRYSYELWSTSTLATGSKETESVYQWRYTVYMQQIFSKVSEADYEIYGLLHCDKSMDTLQLHALHAKVTACKKRDEKDVLYCVQRMQNMDEINILMIQKQCILFTQYTTKLYLILIPLNSYFEYHDISKMYASIKNKLQTLLATCTRIETSFLMIYIFHLICVSLLHTKLANVKGIPKPQSQTHIRSPLSDVNELPFPPTDDSGYLAESEESDTETNSRNQRLARTTIHKKAMRVRNIEECESDSSETFDFHCITGTELVRGGGKFETTLNKRKKHSIPQSSATPRHKSVKKSSPTFSHTSPVKAFRHLELVIVNSSFSKPLAGLTLTDKQTVNQAADVTVSHIPYQTQSTSNNPGTQSHHAEMRAYPVICAGGMDVMKQHSGSNPSQSTSEDLNTENGMIWRLRIKNASQLLDAGYYSKMLEVLEYGHTPPNLPTDLQQSVLFGCGLAYFKMTKFQSALQHMSQFKVIATVSGSTANQGLACTYLGDITCSRGDYTTAVEYYGMALQLYSTDCAVREYNLPLPSRASLHLKQALCYKRMSKMLVALQAYKDALFISINNKDKLSAHTSLGNLYQTLGEYASAIEEYKECIKLAQATSDMVSLGWAHGNIGNAYLGLFQRDRALHHLHQSLELAIQHEAIPESIGRSYNNLATAFQASNELNKAQEYYDLALTQAIYGNDVPGQARVYGNIGNLLMLNKQHGKAISHYSEVLRLAKDDSTLSTAFHNRGCAYYEWGEVKKKEVIKNVSPNQFYIHGIELPATDKKHLPAALNNSVKKCFQRGIQDLKEVVKYHEHTLETIKGSSQGLSLSVSLFETNSRTFHRLQDCYINLEGNNFLEALVIAESCRARTMGEMMLKQNQWALNHHQLHAPLDLKQIKSIVMNQNGPVLYISYTGTQLLLWLLLPRGKESVAISMIQVPLEDEQFDGKSFDYHMRYQLTEQIVEKNIDMYKLCDYKDAANEPFKVLYEIVGQPLIKLMSLMQDNHLVSNNKCIQEIIVIADSYTNLLPIACLLDKANQEFLGDRFIFRVMPSLLTMGILNQLPTTPVITPADGRSMCVVGNPTVPLFTYNGETWDLGKLPYASMEAESIAHLLNSSPLLHEQATKSSVVMRMMNAKVIHLATHGGGASGFVAFSGTSLSHHEASTEAKNVLLHPHEVEKMSISPALVVLSSCNSSRGTLKADGIQGMARAFILAGAQAVLTTLWRMPDESGYSFMKFFYQYLVDGFKASEALHKAILSLRCFSKYSQYIHWSGYQLTGKDVQFQFNNYSNNMQYTIGPKTTFPRLDIVLKMKTVLLNDPNRPTNVQVLTLFISVILKKSIIYKIAVY